MSAGGADVPHPGRVELPGERRFARCRAFAFLRLLLQGDRLQAELVILHRGGFEAKPRGQIGNFLGCGGRRQTVAQLLQSMPA